jgi:two-component system, LytTR family, response regulator
MNCIIIDNEANAIKNLSGIITENFTDVNIVATCAKIVDAVKAINTNNPDVVFLDVELTNETGFDLFDYFPSPQFNVVFCSAHEKYALRAIKASCFDFLLKPVALLDLVNVIEKLKVKSTNNVLQKLDILKKNINAGKDFHQIVVPSLNEFFFINTNDIVCLRADAKYTNIYTIENKTHFSSRNIGEYEEILNDEYFFRCHKSWIINLKHAKKFSKQTNILTLNNDIEVEVSVRKKEEFLQRFFND